MSLDGTHPFKVCFQSLDTPGNIKHVKFDVWEIT